MTDPADQDYATAFCEPCHRGEHVPMKLASGVVVCICCEVARNGFRKAAES